MQQDLQITFRDMKSSAAIEAMIRRQASKLEQVYDRIISCRVMVEAPHRSQSTGNQFYIRIDLTVPGDELVVTRNVDDETHQDPYVAVRDAFRAARRELRKLSGKRKAREVAPAA